MKLWIASYSRICDSLRAAPVPVAFPPAAWMRRADTRIRTGRWGVRKETLGITSLRLTGHQILDLLTEEFFHCLMSRTYKKLLNLWWNVHGQHHHELSSRLSVSSHYTYTETEIKHIIHCLNKAYEIAVFKIKRSEQIHCVHFQKLIIVLQINSAV